MAFVYVDECIEGYRMHRGNNVASSIMQSMRDRAILFDVEMIGQEGQHMTPVRAHTHVLASASEYFRTFFASNDYLTTKGEVQLIRNVTHQSLETLVAFVYEGKCEVGKDDGLVKICNILSAARELKLQDVDSACAEFLSADFFVQQNAVTLAKLAHRLLLHDIAKKPLQFIAANIMQLAETDTVLLLSYDDLFWLFSSNEFAMIPADTRCVVLIKWLNHDTENRSGFVTNILTAVPLTPGSLSIATIREAFNCEAIKKEAPQLLNRAVNGMLTRLESQYP